MAKLFGWLSATDVHPLIASSVFHYEFEFIHPFADGNGRMGRFWQSLILARWHPLFGGLPVESLVFEHQAEYYSALRESTRQTDSAPFITFIGPISGAALQAKLGLSDRKSFRERYLAPALADDLIEMTIPEKPNSRLQKYILSDKGREWVALFKSQK